MFTRPRQDANDLFFVLRPWCNAIIVRTPPGAYNFVRSITGGPSSSCEMIILRNNSHGGIIRVCMGIFMTTQRSKKIHQILNKNISPYFHSVLLVIWLLTLMKRPHFSELGGKVTQLVFNGHVSRLMGTLAVRSL